MPRVMAMRAPTRMDFGGGWTDVPPYCDSQGGTVCAVAIARYATATLQDAPHSSAARPDAAPTNADAPLVRAALADANPHDTPHAQLHSDFPVGAGLGGSSAALAALLGALHRWQRHEIDRVHIAERGRAIEVERLGVAGGRQDHYCATHGGLLGLTFGAGSNVSVEQLPVTPAFREALERRCILVYTGESRISGATITGVLDAFQNADPAVCSALARMRALAIQMIQACRTGNLDALGALVQEHWTHQRALHPAIPTPRIDAIVQRTHLAGALGAKALGASGGGCVLAIARDGAEDAVRRAAAELGQILPFTLDESGLTPCDSTAATL